MEVEKLTEAEVLAKQNEVKKNKFDTDERHDGSNPKIALFIKFDEDEEIELNRSTGEEYKINLIPNGGWMEFSDGKGKRFKFLCKKIEQ